jgi:hypothetical protein
MPTLVDTSLWIDFSRARSPKRLKNFITPYILAEDAAIAEPIAFEVLRHATNSEASQLQSLFRTLPLLATPGNLWSSATDLGQICRHSGVNAGSLDLLIAAVAIHHSAELVTFDRDFHLVAAVCGLKLNLLHRP